MRHDREACLWATQKRRIEDPFRVTQVGKAEYESSGVESSHLIRGAVTHVFSSRTKEDWRKCKPGVRAPRSGKFQDFGPRSGKGRGLRITVTNFIMRMGPILGFSLLVYCRCHISLTRLIYGPDITEHSEHCEYMVYKQQVQIASSGAPLD